VHATAEAGLAVGAANPLVARPPLAVAPPDLSRGPRRVNSQRAVSGVSSGQIGHMARLQKWVARIPVLGQRWH